MSFALDAFLMLIGRLTGLFLSAPIFASRQLPGKVKILLIILLAGLMSYYVSVPYAVNLATPAAFIAAIVLEIFIGYCIGFVAYVIFAAIQLAGQLIDMQMGFAMVNVLDPQTGTQIPLMGNFLYLLALLLYLSMNGHHYLLEALVQSYQLIPVMGVSLGHDFIQLMIEITVYMFVIAVKVSAPVVVAVMVANIAMGFIARTVPQMNVFIVGLPLNIFLGFFMLLPLLPVYMWIMNILFERFIGYLDVLLLTMGM